MKMTLVEQFTILFKSSLKKHHSDKLLCIPVFSIKSIDKLLELYFKNFQIYRTAPDPFNSDIFHSQNENVY
jgi:hypothetical protein